ncbi:SAF domain-containing protein [Isoptericola jiangsuensis]|uniref:SAF domain-containing protein n=1 Tax=Isoptericola jiangsuensis TaxID=548579 RepID=A0A2A9F194_9MICO|nr:SAF domain-containing protein [Isoptericola jiangsuensis]PFG44270.1 SAF domain-containing protein [Isoptericola jiangsuensis]
MPRPSRDRVLRRLHLLAWRSRFVVAAVCCGLAATATVQALRPPAPATTTVVVTSRAVEAGTPLRRADLTTVVVDADLAPALVTDPTDVVGRSSPVRLPAGTPLHPGLATGGGLGDQAPRGTVVVAVGLVEAGWLAPGDRVDLLAADDRGRTLARRALVLPGPAARTDTSGGLLGGTSADGGDRVTLLAVDPDEAAAVSATSGWGTVTAVLVP